MLKSNIIFEDRDVDIVRIEDFSKYSSKGFSIENLVLIVRQGNRDNYFDIGSLCYEKRGITHKVKHFAQVIKSTFNRYVALALRRYLSYKYTSLTVRSARINLANLKATILDLYHLSSQGIDLRFGDIRQCNVIYENYSKLLLAQIKEGFRNPNFSSTKIFSKKQKICAELIAASCNIDYESFREKFVNIKNYTSPNKEKEVAGEQEYRVFTNHCKKIYYEFSEFILNKKKFPLVLDICDEKTNLRKYLYMIRMPVGEQAKYIFDNNGRFLSRVEVVENIKKIDNVSELKVRYRNRLGELPSDIKASYNNYENSIIEANKDSSRPRLRLIKLAIASFAAWLIMDSGCNFESIYYLCTKDIDSLKFDTANHKILSIKPRAGYKGIEISITNEMVQGLKHFKKFREYVLRDFDDETRYLINDRVFFSFDADPLNKNILILREFFSGDYNKFKEWYKNIFGNENWINPRKARRSHTNIIQNLDGIDSATAFDVSAERMGHTKKVEIAYYTESTKEQLHTQLTTFFNNVYDQMIFENRCTKEPIPIALDIESHSTIAGHCVNPNPNRAAGFNEKIESPNCSNPATCLFCENYVLHTDKVDLRKLLSLRKITEIQADLNEDMKIVKYRIDEILNFIVSNNKRMIPLITSIKEEVDEGYLDEHWENILDLLIDLGVQIYD